MAVCGAGFCWGGRPVVTLTHVDKGTEDGKWLVDAVFTGHPAMLAIPADLEKVARPLAIAIGDRDVWMPMAQVDMAKKVLSAVDVAAEVAVYPGAGHGFCVRGDPQNSNQVQQAQEAEDYAISWFQKHIRG